MNTSRKIIISVFLIALLYAIWAGRSLLLGPEIKILSSTSSEATGNPITLKGVAKNISFITLNGRQIFVDKDGNFTEDILLHSGLNQIELTAKDRFGKERDYLLTFYNGQKDNFVENASSTIN